MTVLTGDVTNQLIKTYRNNKKQIEGILEVGGSFGGGTLTFNISVSGGSIKNPWLDLQGNQYSLTAAETVGFKLPVIDRIDNAINIYATLSGSTTPSVTINIVDAL